jgi:hypothetical protein
MRSWFFRKMCHRASCPTECILFRASLIWQCLSLWVFLRPKSEPNTDASRAPRIREITDRHGSDLDSSSPTRYPACWLEIARAKAIAVVSLLQSQTGPGICRTNDIFARSAQLIVRCLPAGVDHQYTSTVCYLFHVSLSQMMDS